MRTARCVTVAVLAAGLLSPLATAQAEPGTAGAGAEPSKVITLISGDEVVVNEKGELLRVEGRPGMTFAQYVQNGHQYVVPADAVGAVAQDRIDKRFFDVTALHSYGYTDDKTDRIPLLNSGFRTAGAVQKKDAAQQWNQRRTTARSAGKLWLDGKARVSLDQSVPMVGAPAAWQAGFDGTGVTVAVLDSGYDQQHPELKDVVAVAKDFSGQGIQDNVGHGTHVASTIAGRGEKYRGVAKGAKLAVGRVCESEGCTESAIIAGMEWATREVRAKVVNMSLGGLQSDGTDPLSLKVNQLTAETGALFVIAAGNYGGIQKVSTPAAADAALAVANSTKQGEIHESSSRGPRFGDLAMKPDIAAPGEEIVAARAAGTLPDAAVDDLHARLSGTSMATPHVAGAAAILVQRNPSITPAELKARLMSTVKPLAFTYSPDEGGTGLLNVGRAVTQQVWAEAGSLSFGLVMWPHTGPVTKTVTYRNDGDQSVSLVLQHDLGDRFTVASSVVVPAHGSAPVDVVLDPGKGLGTFSGRLRASAAGVELTTSVGGAVEPERHGFSLRVTGRDGQPVGNGWVVLVDLATKNSSVLELGQDGSLSTRLPVGDYAVLARFAEGTQSRTWYAPKSVTDVAGKVSTKSDVSVHLDLRQAKQIAFDVDDDRVTPLYRLTTIKVPVNPAFRDSVWSRIDGRVPVYGMSFGEPLPELAYDTVAVAAQPRISVVGGIPVNYFADSPELPQGDHTYDVVERGSADVRGKLVLVRPADEQAFIVARQLKEAGAAGVLWAGPEPMVFWEPTELPVIMVAEHLAAQVPAKLTLRAQPTSPVSYTVHQGEKGAVPAGKTYPVKRSALAEVKARYHTAGADSVVTTRNYPVVDGVVNPDLFIEEPLGSPVTRVEHFSPGSWYNEGAVGRFSGFEVDPLTHSWANLRVEKFEAGRRYERSALRGVAAPRLGRAEAPWPHGGGVSREFPHIQANVSPFGTATAVEGRVRNSSLTMELKRDGVSLGTDFLYDSRFYAPKRDGRFTLDLHATRDFVALSNDVRTTWEFTSPADGKLPLLEVNYALPLDLRNSWKAGVPMPAKFTAARQAGAGKAVVSELRAYASFDDGATWVPVSGVVPAGGKAGGFVSLRVTARDADGNTVDQTVLRAYRLKA
ncbi:S8 family serine peptidase [Lentzea flava]|uniref:Serine protease n=1 Tax=Lentzea flava TaxID=103732 RepID=A0ABQ2UGC4_9PSEU|nr:S8 family serine peptidase [Lentzea flava]MCP2198585.1 Serine protease, subtilisin family [Lentzea flava]GGU26884.1 serine protease [Lentzea flava]